MKISEAKIGELLSDESFLKWLSGKASPEEREKWEQWRDKRPENYALYTAAHDLWENTQFRASPMPDSEDAWLTLLPHLRATPSDSPPSQGGLFAQKRESYRFQSQKRRFRWGYALAAAIIFIMFIWQFASFYKSRAFITLTTQYGEQQQVNLPDGSKIVLNAHSSLKYPKHWNLKTKRQVYLEGEAYFEVTPKPGDVQKEFIVYTSDGLVKVLGTAFVVYERGKGTRVVVERGRVEVHSGAVDDRDKSVSATILTPGHLVYFRRGDQSLHPSAISVGTYISWWKDSFLLDQTPFQEIVQRLEETYGITIEVQDSSALKRVLSGSIENHNLDVILETLSNILQLPVYRQGNKVIFATK